MAIRQHAKYLRVIASVRLANAFEEFPHTDDHWIAFDQRDLLWFPKTAVTGRPGKRFNDMVTLWRTQSFRDSISHRSRGKMVALFGSSALGQFPLYPSRRPV